jgi:hypothetical protein
MSSNGGKSPNDTLKEDAHGILEQFFRAIPWGVQTVLKHLNPVHTLSQDLEFKEKRMESVMRIRSVIENDRNSLMTDAGVLILQYLSRFKVKSDSADPFKICYWFGVALADKVGAVNDIDKRSVLLIAVELLDSFCESHCGKRMPSDMRAKMDMSISEGKYLEEFGHHGLYHSFKSVAKAYC